MNVDVILNAPVTIGLLIANLVLSIVGFRNPRLIDTALFDMRRIRRDGQYQRLLTSGFIHADPIHLAMNMISLVFIGPYLEMAMGAGPYLGFYFACLLGGSLWTLLENFRNLDYRALGASGAVSGVTTGFALFAPFAMILVFVVPMPAILFAVLYIGWSAYASGRMNDGIGHAAHLGGALTGLVLVCLFWPDAIRALWTGLLARF